MSRSSRCRKECCADWAGGKTRWSRSRRETEHRPLGKPIQNASSMGMAPSVTSSTRLQSEAGGRDDHGGLVALRGLAYRGSSSGNRSTPSDVVTR